MGLFSNTQNYSIVLPFSCAKAMDIAERAARSTGKVLMRDDTMHLLQCKTVGLTYVAQFTINFVAIGDSTELRIAGSCGSDGLLVRNGLGKAYESFIASLSEAARK